MVRRSFFNDMNRRLDDAKDAITKKKKMQEIAAMRFGLKDKNAEVKETKKGFKVTDKSEEEDSGPVDMKQYFRRSSKAKTRKDGTGWYLTIPIRLYTPNKSNKGKSNVMSNRMYKDVRKQAQGQTNIQVVSDYLYDNRKTSNIPELNSEPKSNNVDIKPLQRQLGGNQYIAFRTVSDKSPANSWIINREDARGDSLSKDIRDVIKQVRAQSK